MARTLTCFLTMALLAVAGCSETKDPDTEHADVTPTETVAKNAVFEVALTCDAVPANPFTEANAGAAFVSPSGETVAVPGFYYGGAEWRVRFVPREHGVWRWKATLTAPGGDVAKQGAFRCEGTTGRGFLRLSERNRYRMEYEDGTPFYPIGIQTCSFLTPDFDGPAADGSWRSTSAAEWVEAFDGAVNLVRTQLGQGTRSGCALPLIKAGDTKKNIPPGAIDRYDTDLAAKMDDVFRLHRAHNISQILILFQDMSLWGDPTSVFGKGRDLVNFKNVNAPNMPDQERYIRYVVARFGCFVDVWELFNEDSYAPNDYLAHLAKVLRDADPYDHLITTNYARPAEPWCEIVTWHEYMGMPPNGVDAYVASQIAIYKSYGKVVQNTEFGNQGKLSNFDPVKWRIAVWTAFLNESGLLFWGMSGRKTVATGVNRGGNANAYIGPESRQYFRVLNAFNRDMPVDMKPVPSGYLEHTDLRTCALSNGEVTALYVHHFSDHEKEYQLPYKLFVETGPGKFRVRWIDPADGKEIQTEEVSTVQQFLSLMLPPVKIDAACRIDRIDR